MKLDFFYGVFIGFVVALGVSGVLTVQLEKDTWNNAVSLSARTSVKELNKFKGFDQTFDLGYDRCQNEVFDAITGLKRE